MEKKELIYYRLDEVDEKILAMLQDNARVSLKDIGAEVSMSPTAVGTRIDRMLAEGVLEDLRPSSTRRLWVIISRHLSIWRFHLSRRLSSIHI